MQVPEQLAAAVMWQLPPHLPLQVPFTLPEHLPSHLPAHDAATRPPAWRLTIALCRCTWRCTMPVMVGVARSPARPRSTSAAVLISQLAGALGRAARAGELSRPTGARGGRRPAWRSGRTAPRSRRTHRRHAARGRRLAADGDAGASAELAFIFATHDGRSRPCRLTCPSACSVPAPPRSFARPPHASSRSASSLSARLPSSRRRRRCPP